MLTAEESSGRCLVVVFSSSQLVEFLEVLGKRRDLKDDEFVVDSSSSSRFGYDQADPVD
jgi:hypothetical protein